MARLARIVAPGRAHHVTQRGNRRMQTFFCDEDYQAYLSLLGEWCGEFDVRIWAYCLMPNHVHLILVPSTADGLRRAVAEVHRRYTRMINFREGWRGCLWQGRFASFVMSEKHLMGAVRYVERNPVKAGLVTRAEDWRWSSAGYMNAHLQFISQAAGDDKHVVLVLDQAGWHLAKALEIPPNITLLHLPPYSPELNPAERLWAYLKSHYLSNQVFRDYDHLLSASCQAWNALSEE